MSDFFFDDSKDLIYDDDFGLVMPAYRPAVSPGKVSLTSRIARRHVAAGPRRTAKSQQGTPTPVQYKAMTPVQGTHGSEMSDWNLAFRPDLSDVRTPTAPIQRKQQNEIPENEIPEPNSLPQVSGSGAALPDDVRAQMEGALGADFSAVRIHEGSRAASAGALAYTQGADIHFQPGQYDPQSQRGRELLGHELGHVVQQSQGKVRSTKQARGFAINDDSSLEREADEMGAKAARVQSTRPRGTTISAIRPGSNTSPALPAQAAIQMWKDPQALQEIVWVTDLAKLLQDRDPDHRDGSRWRS